MAVKLRRLFGEIAETTAKQELAWSRRPIPHSMRSPAANGPCRFLQPCDAGSTATDARYARTVLAKLTRHPMKSGAGLSTSPGLSLWPTEPRSYQGSVPPSFRRLHSSGLGLPSRCSVSLAGGVSRPSSLPPTCCFQSTFVAYCCCTDLLP
jgi:hypothetical protein